MLDVIVSKLLLLIIRYDLDRQKTCMVGDRLDTDIEFGKTGGIQTLLVLSGVTSFKEMKSSTIKADFYINFLSDLYNLQEN